MQVLDRKHCASEPGPASLPLRAGPLPRAYSRPHVCISGAWGLCAFLRLLRLLSNSEPKKRYRQPPHCTPESSTTLLMKVLSFRRLSSMQDLLDLCSGAQGTGESYAQTAQPLGRNVSSTKRIGALKQALTVRIEGWFLHMPKPGA